MKKVFIFCFMMGMLFSLNAAFAAGNNTAHIFTETAAIKKKINITIQVQGYSVTIVGYVDYSLMGNTTINVTITINGNNINVSIPFQYTGKLDARGNFRYTYDDKSIVEEDKGTVAMIMSRLYLPGEKGGKPYME